MGPFSRYNNEPNHRPSLVDCRRDLNRIGDRGDCIAVDAGSETFLVS
jgi:hypothetical protein